MPVDADSAVVGTGEGSGHGRVVDGGPRQDLGRAVGGGQGQGAVGEQHGAGVGGAHRIRVCGAGAGAGRAGDNGVVVVGGEGDAARRWGGFGTFSYIAAHLRDMVQKDEM